MVGVEFLMRINKFQQITIIKRLNKINLNIIFRIPINIIFRLYWFAPKNFTILLVLMFNYQMINFESQSIQIMNLSSISRDRNKIKSRSMNKWWITWRDDFNTRMTKRILICSRLVFFPLKHMDGWMKKRPSFFLFVSLIINVEPWLLLKDERWRWSYWRMWIKWFN